VVVADVDSAFRAHSPDGILGKELLWEHVHPTLDGYELLSQTWFKAMRSIPFQLADVNEKLRAALSDSLLRASVGSTELDAEFGAQTMRKLLHRWPFVSAGGDQETELPHDPIGRAAALFINGTLRWNESHYELADAYLKDKQYARALREYKAVNSYYPDDAFPLMRMGDMYALLENNESAAGALLRVLEITENQFIHLKLGVLYAKSGRPDLSLVHLSSAFELDSHSASHFSRTQFEEATYYYAFALFKSGKIEEAKQTLSMLMENDPANARSAQLWAQINKGTRK
jgi:tetratricopeptide (TPR) repeat protein